MGLMSFINSPEFKSMIESSRAPFSQGGGQFADFTNPEKALGGTATGLYRDFSRISREGLLGEEGVQRITNESISRSAKEAAFRRKMLAAGLRKRMGRRLGTRSGAVDTLVANEVYAPSFADFERGAREVMVNTLLQNLMSKGFGYEQALRLIGIAVNRQKEESGGVLGFLGDIGDIAVKGATAIGALQGGK